MAEWNVGSGFYQWVDLDGELRTGAHWDDLPERMDRLVAFIPASPKGPHTQQEHDAMATFNDRFREVLSRCRQ